MQSTSIVTLVGPGEAELVRATRVLHSVSMAGEANAQIVVVNDDFDRPDAVCYETLAPTPTIVISHPRRNLVETYSGKTGDHPFARAGGGLTCAVLAALRWIVTKSPTDIIVKLDTDAYVLAPFSGRIRDICRACAEVGIIGTVGRQMNPDDGCDQDALASSPLLTLYRSYDSCNSDSLRESVRTLRPLIERAIINGYATSIFCLGGAYALSKVMLERLLMLGALSDDMLRAWTQIPIGEDVSLGMLAHACNLQVHDSSGPGEIFAVSWKGVHKSPTALYAQGTCIVHSLKNHPELNEGDLLKDCVALVKSSIEYKRQSRRLYIYAHQDSMPKLCNSSPKTIVYGAYLGQPRFGPLSQVLGALRVHRRFLTSECFVIVDAGEIFGGHIKYSQRCFSDSPPLVFATRPLPDGLLRSEKLEPIDKIKEVSVIHLCGTLCNSNKQMNRLFQLGEALIGWLKPAQYIMSSVYCDDDIVGELVNHIQRTKPCMIGTQDAQSLCFLRRYEVAAEWAADDSIAIFRSIGEQQMSEPSNDHLNFALECSCPPSMFWEAGTYNSARALFAAGNMTRDIRALELPETGDAVPIMMNSSLEDGHGRSLWSSIVSAGLTYQVPVFTAIDLVALLASDRLCAARDQLVQANVGKVVVADLHVALFANMLGYPTFMFPYFGTYSDRARRMIGQHSYDISVFMHQDQRRWRRWSIDQMAAWTVVRDSWELKLASSLHN